MIYLIGMGPGNLENLTMEATRALKASASIISFGRIGSVVEHLSDRLIKVKSILEIKDVLDGEKRRIEESKIISILASGDPCFYGILEYLKREEVEIDRVISGISSIQYMMSKLQMSWHGANLVSFHGREEEGEEKIRSIIDSPMSIILTDKKNTPSDISSMLKTRGMYGTIYAGFDLSYEDEEIIKADIGDTIVDKSSLAVVVVESKERS